MPADEPVVLASAQRVVARDPLSADADTLFAEYVESTGGATHDRVHLSGPVTCYGGPALEGNLPAEVYVRRGINRVAVVEDIVEIYPDDLKPRRRVVSMQRGPGVSPIAGGHALVEDSAGAKTVQAYRNADGATVILAHDASKESMRIVVHALDGGAKVDLDALAEESAWKALQARVGELASQSAVMTIRGELPAIPADRCESMFARFPKP